MSEVVPIRNPSTVLFGVSSADRHNQNKSYTDAPPEWDAGVTYAAGDIVKQNELIYISLINANINNDPSLTLATDWDYYEVGFTTKNSQESPFKFTLYSQQAFLNGYFTRIALTEISFTWAIPTITARNNKIGIRYVNGGTTQQGVLTLTPGWYDPASLAAEVQTLFRTATGITAFTLVANSDNGSFTGNTNGAQTFAFVPVIPSVSGTGTNPVTKSQPDRIQLFDMMGWGAGTGTTAGTYTLASLQTSGLPSMLSTKFVDIVSTRITALQNTRDGDTGLRPRDVIARVYLYGESDQLNPEQLGSEPFTVYKNYTLPKQITWDPTVPLGQLSFELYDDTGYPLSTLDSSPTLVYFNDKDQPDWNATFLASEA